MWFFFSSFFLVSGGCVVDHEYQLYLSSSCTEQEPGERTKLTAPTQERDKSLEWASSSVMRLLLNSLVAFTVLDQWRVFWKMVEIIKIG